MGEAKCLQKVSKSLGLKVSPLAQFLSVLLQRCHEKLAMLTELQVEKQAHCQGIALENRMLLGLWSPNAIPRLSKADEGS